MNTTRSARCAALVVATALVSIACGDAPQPVDTPPPRPAALPPGHPPVAGGGASTPRGLPPDHPPIGGGAPAAAGPDAVFEGRVILSGELAHVDEGFLIVSVRAKGSKAPMRSYKTAVDDPRTTESAGETRIFHFRLDRDTDMMGGGEVPEGIPLELQVLYDPDGYVESKEGQEIAVVPVERGQGGIEVRLPAGP
ncbi:MAG TPA: hypothetical protein VMS76_17550 [Planctomycetota bacterium]|nr:hypothetical protein [Planctomycetota bacterium]